MRLLLTLLFTISFYTCVSAQTVLLLEREGKAKTEKISEGEPLRFRMAGDKFWQEGYIREMRPDIGALVINDRFIMLDEIDAIHRGSTFAKAAGLSLMTFGVVYPTIGVIGYNTDGDPDSQISGGELAVGAASLGLGYLLYKFLGSKKFRTGPRRRLRIVDTTF